MLTTLPTSTIAALVDGVHHRLHIDPTDKLPAEITEIIFLHLAPQDLLSCSLASRKWRGRVLDSKLWKAKCLHEGWTPDLQEMQHHIEAENARRILGPTAHRRKLDGGVEPTSSRKRHQRVSLESISRDSEARAWGDQYGLVEADDEHRMTGVESHQSEYPSHADIEALSPLSVSTVAGGATRRPALNEEALYWHERNQSHALSPPLEPKLYDFTSQSVRMNWFYLYKQRQRLESNWNNGRYTTFRLPKREFPEDMHSECVYAIQYNNDYLVSGSRDKSLKIWNLKTERCELTLAGEHDQSVLCLQFDQAQDIIVSGGSDSFVIIWKFSDGSVVRKMTNAHTESVLNLRFDDRYLITCSKDKSIKIWNRFQISKDDPIIPRFALNDLHRNHPADVLREYSLLATLNGHQAAVNAIQVLGDKIVSASGDRTIHLWDIHTGQIIRPYHGHTKGIACVQYDGRRIISGSSDNTVRIFDVATAAEVACLAGHSALVRTLQARFGDMLDSDLDLEVQAREHDQRWLATRDNGMTRAQHRSGRPRNAVLGNAAGSDVIGAKLPPGGGGSRWSRIVSGSYDQSVIIWRKDNKGSWVCDRRLNQEEILNDSRNQRRAHRMPGTQMPQQPALQIGIAAALPPGANTAVQMPQQQQPLQQALQQGNAQGAPHHHQSHPPQPPQAPHGGPGAHAVQQIVVRPRPDESNRVFKLQFDSRRIVACSQNQVIVGWDFANGDSELEEVSRFFAETE